MNEDSIVTLLMLNPIMQLQMTEAGAIKSKATSRFVCILSYLTTLPLTCDSNDPCYFQN